MHIILRNSVSKSLRSLGPASFDQLVGSMFDDLDTAKRRGGTGTDSESPAPRINLITPATALKSWQRSQGSQTKVCTFW